MELAGFKLTARYTQRNSVENIDSESADRLKTCVCALWDYECGDLICPPGIKLR